MPISAISRATSAFDKSVAYARQRSQLFGNDQPVAGASALSHWTHRVASQPEAISARELSGLNDDELSALSAEFERTPRLNRTDAMRFGLPVGALLCAAGALGATVHFLALYQPGAPASNLLLVSLALAGLGLVALCLGSLAAYMNVSTHVAYSQVGLFVGVLDERHPWLYKASLALNHPAAERYRERVVLERGPVRGVDYLMMREIAEAHDNLDMTQSARTVARRLQRVAEGAMDVEAPAPSPAVAPEPKLVSVMR